MPTSEERFTSREVQAALEAVIRYERGRARRLLGDARSEARYGIEAINEASRRIARALEESVTKEPGDA